MVMSLSKVMLAKLLFALPMVTEEDATSCEDVSSSQPSSRRELTSLVSSRFAFSAAPAGSGSSALTGASGLGLGGFSVAAGSEAGTWTHWRFGASLTSSALPGAASGAPLVASSSSN